MTGYIAYRGVTGSTFTAIGINIIQLATLVIFSGLAIWYRIANPAACRPVGVLRGLRHHEAPHALRHTGPVDDRHTDPGRLRELHRLIRGDEERGKEHPESDHHLPCDPGGIRLSLRILRRRLHDKRQAGQRRGQGDHHGHGGGRRIERPHRGSRAAPREQRDSRPRLRPDDHHGSHRCHRHCGHHPLRHEHGHAHHRGHGG